MHDVVLSLVVALWVFKILNVETQFYDLNFMITVMFVSFPILCEEDTKIFRLAGVQLIEATVGAWWNFTISIFVYSIWGHQI